MISRRVGSDASYYIYDGGLSVRALTNEAGTVTDTLVFDAFGNETAKTGSTDNAYGFQGEEKDETGLYYLRARYMDPSTGTFTSMDTYGGSLSDPMSLHKYMFANSNPVIYSDPSGHMSSTFDETLAVVAIISILAVPLLYSVAMNNSKSTSSTNSFVNSKYYHDVKTLSDIKTFNDIRKGLLSIVFNAIIKGVSDNISGQAQGLVDHGLSGSGGIINPNNNIKKTNHGRHNSRKRGFNDNLIDEIRNNPSQKVYQSEGRVVYAKRINNYYYVVIENSEGEIITTVGGKTHSLRTWSDVLRMLNNNGGYSTIPWR